MKFEYFGKNYEISDQLKKMSEKKCRKLGKFFDDKSVAKFTFTFETNNFYKVELVVISGASTFRAEGEGANPYKILDIVVPKVEGQVKKKRSEQDAKNQRKHNEFPRVEVCDVGRQEEDFDIEPPKPEF